MAIGDASDIQARLRKLIPWSWFPYGLSPLYEQLIAGLAGVFAAIYGLIAYVKNQTRLQSTTDGFLDLTAFDFFADGLPRRGAEQDGSYQQRIKLNILRRRVTRPAVIKVLEDLTGRTPVIFEPRRAADTGAYGAANLGYGVAGGYGSRQLPLQAFITAFRPIGGGVPNVAGYGVPVAGYGVTSSQSEYASLRLIVRTISDADIYAAVDSVRPTCAILWTRIASGPSAAPSRQLATPTGSPIETPSGEDILIPI
ncbi:MAG: hypothetical protein ACREUT_10545 [Steroidobacteraceae bacterium]